MELNNLKNVVIGFDVPNSLVRIFRINSDQSQAVCNDIKVDKALFDRGEYSEALRSAVGFYIKNIASIQSAYVVLPDNLVTMDYIHMPKVNRKKIMEALRAEMVNLYANSGMLNILSTQVDTPKDNLDYSLYLNTMSNMNFINDISTGLAKTSVQPRVFSYSAACSLNALLDRRSDLRSANFIFADVRQHSTIITMCSNSTIRAFYDMPFGYDVLRSDRVYPENAINDNSIAQDAVNAALSRASGGKTTIERKPAPNFDMLDLPPEGREKARLDYFDSILPQPMRIIPYSNEQMDVLYANFTIFERRLDMFAAANNGVGDLPVCDRIVVNLPEEFYFFKDVLGESYKTIPYDFVDNRNKNTAYVSNFDLYGVLLTRKFNTDQVF